MKSLKNKQNLKPIDILKLSSCGNNLFNVPSAIC